MISNPKTHLTLMILNATQLGMDQSWNENWGVFHPYN